MRSFNISSDYQDLINFLNNKKPSSIVIITDNTVGELYLAKIKSILSAVNTLYPIDQYLIPAGEQYKTRETKALIEDYLLAKNYDKQTCLIALGGGVITDLLGFVAATYLRGISAVYIPTTLLAMIDAAIGGKTAVNTAYGKNLIGCFKQPDLIMLDTNYLKTLNNQEYISAFAEIIKHASIADKDYFNFLINNYTILLARENNERYFTVLNNVISRSITIKTHIVKLDELEITGVRHQLNFGHTIGHAIEAASNYDISHGYAVAIGIIVESRIALQLGVLSNSDYNSIVKIIELYNLDLYLKPDLFSTDFLDKFFASIQRDKKNDHKAIKMILIQSIGECYIKDQNTIHQVGLKMIGEVLNIIINQES